ncbi:MAG: aa3-type cytochrome c oxidase subunit IV [Rubrimonas sp.]
MAEHRPGEMDVSEQEKTFHGFLRLTAYAIAVVVAILLLLTFRI